MKEVSTFDASSAMFRIELLVDEIESLIPILKPTLDDSYLPAFFEFVSYYKVGFATCLEWHAKSRLYDLFCFNPSLIETNDLKQTLSNDKLRDMIVERLSVPQILANANNISTSEAYISVFKRIFLALGADRKFKKILSSKLADHVSYGAVLNRLFDDRNTLVHEISITDIGHRNIRDYSTLADANLMGRQLINFMKLIEKEISSIAPAHFPNLLNEYGVPSERADFLHKEIVSLEAKFMQQITSEEYREEPPTEEIWKELSQQRNAAMEAELHFIENLDLPGRRYYDVRPYLKQKLFEGHLAYLEELSRQILSDPELE